MLVPGYGLMFSCFLSASGYSLTKYRSSKVTFLPYGDGSLPGALVKTGDQVIAVEIGAEDMFQESPARELIVDQSPEVVLIRNPGPKLLSQIHEQGLRALVIHAGPFESLSGAIRMVKRWRSEYFGCYRDSNGKASCFEFGGCHKQCWWREEKTVALCAEVWQLGGQSATESIKMGINNFDPPANPTAFFDHEADEVQVPSSKAASSGQSSKRSTEAEESIGTLGASFVFVNKDRVYCGLYPI